MSEEELAEIFVRFALSFYLCVGLLTSISAALNNRKPVERTKVARGKRTFANLTFSPSFSFPFPFPLTVAPASSLPPLILALPPSIQSGLAGHAPNSLICAVLSAGLGGTMLGSEFEEE